MSSLECSPRQIGRRWFVAATGIWRRSTSRPKDDPENLIAHIPEQVTQIKTIVLEAYSPTSPSAQRIIGTERFRSNSKMGGSFVMLCSILLVLGVWERLKDEIIIITCIHYFIWYVGAMLRRRRSCRKKHFRQIRLNVVPKLPLMKLRYYNVSEDEGLNRLKDEMTS
jgi:hypothetical protein